jgi:hypothetical protein
MKKQPNKYARIYALINKLRLSDDDKQALVYSHTNERTISLKEMTDEELQNLTDALVEMSPKSTQPKGMRDDFGKKTDELDTMRKKVIALLGYDLGWQKYSKQKNRMVADVSKIKVWVEKYGKHKKPLNDLTKKELAELVTQTEEFVKRELNRDLKFVE